MHTIGYGLLFFRNLVIVESVIVLINLGILSAFYNFQYLLGTKLFASIVLLYIRFETLRLKLPNLTK